MQPDAILAPRNSQMVLMSKSHPRPFPLYPAYDELKAYRAGDFPSIAAQLAAGEPWWQQNWQWGAEFLKYIGRNKSEHTYARFRNETERFLLWLFLLAKKPIDACRKADILDYADFLWHPPEAWVGLNNADRFVLHNGIYQPNSKWQPFRLVLPKAQQAALNAKQNAPDKKKYRPSQQTLTASFTAVVALYKYLMGEELCYGNPAQIAKGDCRYFIKDAQVKEVRRLSSEQWDYVLEAAEEMAASDSLYERSLFVVATLKTLFLRISELSERPGWLPMMSHFWQDEYGNWWLKVFGKGRKLRDVSVPDSYLPYLKRYRTYRALPALPASGDTAPIVEKIRGQGGMTARHLARLVKEVLEQAYRRMRAREGEEKALKLKEASTHWLRHTGASMEVERGRALKDLSEDLGHASMATTDTIYVQSETQKRAASGKGRRV